MVLTATPFASAEMVVKNAAVIVDVAADTVAWAAHNIFSAPESLVSLHCLDHSRLYAEVRLSLYIALALYFDTVTEYMVE